MLMQHCSALGRAWGNNLTGRCLYQLNRHIRSSRKLRPQSPISKLPVTKRIDVTGQAGTKPTAITSKTKQQSLPNTFQDVKIIQPLMDALGAAGISQPTEIQAMAIPAILAGGDWLLASHTGSGKTLAYLLPLIQQLKQQEEQEGTMGRPKRPRILVLGPTKELTEQISRVAKSLAHHAKFRAVGCSAGGRLPLQQRALSGPVDVLVATPTRVLQHQKEGNVALGDVNWLVIDEADTMFDQGFGQEVSLVMEAVKNKRQPAHVVLVTATMTKAVQKLVAAQLPQAQKLQTSGLHKAVANSRHVFMSIPPGRDKMDMLSEVVSADTRRGKKVLVFCGSMDSARAVHHYVMEHDIPAVCYHGDIPIRERKEVMAAFGGATPDAPGAANVMVASDLAARGLDFSGTIDHVINFDFPRTAVDYLHRTGRTARAGAPGKITSLVAKRDKVLASRIEWALDHNEPLDQLSAKKEVLPPSQRKQAAAAAAKAAGKQKAEAGSRAGAGPKVSGPGRRGSSRFAGPDAGSGSRSKGGFGAGKKAGPAAPGKGAELGGGGGNRRGSSSSNRSKVTSRK